MTSHGNSMVTDLTQGKVLPLLLRFSLPLFVSNALQGVYNLVDMIIVGQWVGEAGMSAVSIGGDLLHLLTFLAMGFSSAGQVLIAHDVGVKDRDAVNRMIGTMSTFLLGTSVVLSLVCFFLKEPILLLLHTPDESWRYTMDYTVTCIVGLFFIYGYNTVSAILRGMGDSKRPFLFIAIAAILNIILDLVFVVLCGMEVFGAALATVIGQGVSFLYSVFYLWRKQESFGFAFRPESFRIDRPSFSRLLSLGIPMAIQSAAVTFSKIVLMAWINQEGVTYSALAGIYNKTGMIAGIVSNSFTAAGSTMIGQNLGAREYRRIPHILLIILVIGLILTVPASLFTLFFSSTLFRAFTGDQEVLDAAFILVVPIILNLFGCATRSVSFALINGSGNTRLNLAVALLDGLLSRIGLAALFGFVREMKCEGFWYGDALAGFVPFLIGVTYYLSGRWKREKDVLPLEEPDVSP